MMDIRFQTAATRACVELAAHARRCLQPRTASQRPCGRDRGQSWRRARPAVASRQPLHPAREAPWDVGGRRGGCRRGCLQRDRSRHRSRLPLGGGAIAPGRQPTCHTDRGVGGMKILIPVDGSDQANAALEPSASHSTFGQSIGCHRCCCGSRSHRSDRVGSRGHSGRKGLLRVHHEHRPGGLRQAASAGP